MPQFLTFQNFKDNLTFRFKLFFQLSQRFTVYLADIISHSFAIIEHNPPCTYIGMSWMR